MFGDWVVDKKTQIRMYTYFVAAMVCEENEWMATTLQDKEAEMKINPSFFEDYVELFRGACNDKNVSKQLSDMLLEKLHEHKQKICVNAGNPRLGKHKQTIVQRVEETRGVEDLIKEFWVRMSSNAEIQKSGYYASE